MNDQHPDEAELSQLQTAVVTRAANEGIPIGAIARILCQPYALIADMLRAAMALGHIGEVPKADWPPGAKWAERLPSVPRSANVDDVEFFCRKKFRLTPLEAGFMTVIMRFDCADKSKLHNVVETRRARRALRPDKQEETDPKIVDVVICKLRAKLKAVDPELVIHTSWGKGYYIEPKVKTKLFDMVGAETIS